MQDTETIRATLRLHLADGVGAVTFHRLIAAFGSPQGVLAAGHGGLTRVKGVGDKTADAILAVTEQQVDEELAEAAKRGATILTQDDPAYPAGLKTIPDPPAVLYVRGSFEPADAIAVGVVGARRCTHYGLEQAERFGELLGRAGLTVVSGGARGIDTGAHRGALRAGGRTVAVMGCGLSHAYPPENAALFEEIVSGGHGALISELPMRTSIMAGNFPTRNRIISGLSLGVLIVEAALRSGSLITAREAAEQGRIVFAVPGRVDSPTSQGANKLIRDGAILVQDLDDLLEHLEAVGRAMAPDRPAEGSDVTPSNVTEDESRILAVITGAELGLEEIVRRSGLPAAKVTGSMTMLVLKGAVVQKPGNVFARKKVGRAK